MVRAGPPRTGGDTLQTCGSASPFPTSAHTPSLR
jgi:hypothetical protein